MPVLEGKSTSERNKIIAAALLGLLALVSLWFAFGPSIGGSTKVTVTASPTPSRPNSQRELGPVEMPSRQEQMFDYVSTPVVYTPGAFGAPEPGRNIFAFYEPPPPCPTCPTPLPPTPKPVIATPTPPLPFEIYGANPQTVYAGSKSFRMDVAGDRFTPDAKIYFNNVELPTNFVNGQRLSANVPANMIATAGSPSIKVQTPDGSKYSLQTNIVIQPPPTPNFTYIGMIARKRYNNDTAYFMEQGKTTPTAARLNDVVAGRFRLINVDAERVVLEDVNLGFRHEVKLDRTVQASTGPAGRPGGFPAPGGFQPYNPGGGQLAPGIPGNPQIIPAPGIPPNVPIYTPPQRPNRGGNTNSNVKRDVDDEDDDEDTDNR
jgi:hypothetical protein